MKKIFTLLIALIFGSAVSAQTDDPCGSCFPEGILFETQAQIDSFQYNYPFCTVILGDVNIGHEVSNNYNIANLNGLSQITSIGGSLKIQNNQSLTSLSGLENISFIGDAVEIDDNENLHSLAGLEGISSLVSSFSIRWNDNLTDLTELHSLDTIGALNIVGNISLTSLSGFDSLTYCSGLRIYYNNALTSLAGLENINEESVTELWINKNSSLSTCETNWLCNYLANPSGSISIYDNASGCDSPHEIADLCGLTLSCLPYGNYYFTSQLDVDEFSSIYPDCYALEGNVHIRDGDITDLSGLSQVTSITGGLFILDNDSLSSLAGLNNINSVDRLFISGNDSLVNFMGLDNLTSSAGGVLIWSNLSLTNMTGLDNLIYTGSLSIMDNQALQSLTGLDNIDSDSLDYLEIRNNYSLSQCEIESICNYLSALNGTFDIENNATGCNYPEQVLDSCEANAVGVAEQFLKDALTIYPNPCAINITIGLTTKPSRNTILTLSSINGQQLITQEISGPKTEINISHLPAGIYIVKVWNDRDVMVRKVIKE